MKIWNILKRFKLKVIGLCFIFIMITPALLPTISSSLIQTRNKQNLNDISILSFLDFYYKKIPNPSELVTEKNSHNLDLGEIQVKLLASIHQVGGLTAKNCKIEWDDNIIQYDHPFGEEIVVNSQILTIKFSADVMYGPFPDHVSKIYTINITSQADFDENVYTTLYGDKLYFSLDFPAICFASNLTVQQDGQEVVEVDTDRPFKVNFSLNNLKTEIFQGNWTLYQKIGDAENSSLFSGDITMGNGIQWIARDINLTGEEIPSDTPITYYVKIESDSFWQRTDEEWVMANPSKPFIASIELEWEEWYDLGIFNYGEPYSIKVDIYNPTSQVYTDTLVINESLGVIYNDTLFNESVSLLPNENYEIILEDLVIDWEKWKWFNLEAGEIYETSLEFRVFSSLKNLQPNGLIFKNSLEISNDKDYLSNLFYVFWHMWSYCAQAEQNIFAGLEGIAGAALIFTGCAVVAPPPVNVACTLIAAGLSIYAFFAALGFGPNYGELKALFFIILVMIADLMEDPPIPIENLMDGLTESNYSYSSLFNALENGNFSDIPEIELMRNYLNLLSDFAQNFNKTHDAYINYNIASMEKNNTERKIQAQNIKNLTHLNNEIVLNITEIQKDALGTPYIWNLSQTELEKLNCSYECFLSNLSIAEQNIKENEPLLSEIIQELKNMGYNDTEIEEAVNYTMNASVNLRNFIQTENETSNEIKNYTDEFINIRDEVIAKANLAADEILYLSDTNTTSKVNISQNYAATKRAIISVLPTSIHITPGQTGQFNIKIENLLDTSEPFYINLKNIPPTWGVDYQSELMIPGLATEEIPINISIPQITSEHPRVENIRIIISNTVVDFNSSVLISVRPYHEIELDINPKTLTIEPEEIAICTVDIINLGNVEDTFDIYLKGQIPNSIIELGKNQITFGSNEMVSIKLNITILENWASIENQNYNFTLTVISSNQVTKNSSNFEITVITTPKNMMLFIISEISELQNEINTNLNGTIKNLLLNKLDKAIIRINESIKEYEIGNYSRAIILDKLVKINIIFSEILVYIGDITCKIEKNYSKYLISRLHIIRDHITLTMGKIVDTTLSLEIAQIQIEILKIADNIYNYPSVSLIDAISINTNLWQASEWLDLALVNLADEYDNITSVYIQKAIRNLKQTQCIVNLLHWIGSLSDEDSQQIKDIITIQIDRVNML
ncbi:MAG: COG1470 family protein [Candidatus Helarchaeota archaeon]